MKIKIDYYCKTEDEKIVFLGHVTVDEEDIFEMLHDKYDNGNLPLPIHLNREKITPEFLIDEVVLTPQSK